MEFLFGLTINNMLKVKKIIREEIEVLNLKHETVNYESGFSVTKIWTLTTGRFREVYGFRGMHTDGVYVFFQYQL